MLQLKLGFIAVRNRTANEKISLENARMREREFFRGHIASSVVGSDRLGISALINRLADLYADRVQEKLPQIRKEIQNKLERVRQQLSNFPVVLDTHHARSAKYQELIDLFVDDILKSRLSNGDQFCSLVNVFHVKFAKFQKILDMQTKFLYGSDYFAKVRKAMSDCAGEQLPNFVPNPLLKRFVNEKIEELWRTTKALINDCHAKTLEFLLNDKNNDKYEENCFLLKLLPAFSNFIELYLNKQRQSTMDQLQGLMKIEKNDPYTVNKTYMELIGKFKSERRAKLTDKKNSNDDQAVHDMVESIRSYWEIIRKRFLDYVTLSVRDRFVFSVCDGVRERLRKVPFEQCDFVDSYLAEDAHIRDQREKLQQLHDQLLKCLDILGGRKVTDTSLSVLPTIKSELDELMGELDDDDVNEAHDVRLPSSSSSTCST